MNTKRFVVPFALSVAALASSGVAKASLIDFESTPLGTYSSLSFNSGEAVLTFLGGDGLFDIGTGSPGFPIDGRNAISFFTNPGPSPFQLDFFAATNYVQVGVGDFNTDVDNTFMDAFDSGGNLIGSASYVNPLETNGGGFLTIAAPANIAYVRFRDEEPFAGAVYWDNITYENRTNPEVPEPATLALFGLGLAFIGIGRRKKSPNC